MSNLMEPNANAPSKRTRLFASVKTLSYFETKSESYASDFTVEQRDGKIYDVYREVDADYLGWMRHRIRVEIDKGRLPPEKLQAMADFYRVIRDIMATRGVEPGPLVAGYRGPTKFETPDFIACWPDSPEMLGGYCKPINKPPKPLPIGREARSVIEAAKKKPVKRKTPPRVMTGQQQLFEGGDLTGT